MDGIGLYKELQEKMAKQEKKFEADTIEKLVPVKVADINNFGMDDIVEEDGMQTTAKEVLMNAISTEYSQMLGTADAYHITDNVAKLREIEAQTQKTRENIDKIDQYALNNTERTDKRRNQHRAKVNSYAKKIIAVSANHQEAFQNVLTLKQVAPDILDARQRKTLKKAFEKRYKLDLSVIENEYQMNKALIKMGGKKDLAEENSLLGLKYTRYAKLMAANKRGIEMARRYPDLFDEAKFQKELDKLDKKMREVAETVSPEYLESKKDYIKKATQRRATRERQKRDREEMAVKVASLKEKHGARIQAAIDTYIKKAEDEKEVAWLKEQLSTDAIYEALLSAEGSGTQFLLQDLNIPGNGEEFHNNFDLALSVFIDRYLFHVAASVSYADTKQLLRSGMTEPGIERVISTQLRPVRRLKNGTFVSREDEQNYNFNRKYINSHFNNDMDARKECIEENLKYICGFKINMDKVELDDFFETDSWNRFMLARFTLGISNLCDDQMQPGSSIQNSNAIAKELCKKYFKQKVKVGEVSWDYSSFLSSLFLGYKMLALSKHSVDLTDMKISPNMLAHMGEDGKKSFFADTKTFIEGYKKLNEQKA